MKTHILLYFLFFSLLVEYSHAQQKLNFTPLTDADTSLTPIESAFNNKLNDVKIVGLGEATHGDKTTFAFNFKMIKYLVGERGYRTLIIEAPNSICRPLNAFLQNDSVYTAHQVDTLVYKSIPYGPDRDLQFVSLIKWLKDYNLGHKDHKVSICGMSVDITDMQVILNSDIKPHDPSGADAIAQKWKKPGYHWLDKWNDLFNWQDTHAQLLSALADTTMKRITADLDDSKTALELYLDILIVRENKNELVLMSSNGTEIKVDRDNFFWKLRSNPDYHRKDSLNRFARIYKMRDSLMAAYTLKEAGNLPSVLWAHDGHVMKPGAQMMGDYLNRALGKQYFTIITDYTAEGQIIAFNPLLFIKKSPDAMAGRTMVKELKRKYGVTEGIVFSDDLVTLGYTDAGIHGAGIEGLFSISDAPVKSFNALAILGALQPVDFMK